MRRNMDLIRQLLLGIEGEASTQHEFRHDGIDAVSAEAMQ